MKAPTDHIQFPVAIDARLGRWAQEPDYERYIQQLIRQVLFTGQGERINRPTFGAGIRRLIFAPNSPATASLAQTLVYQALTTWLGTLIRTDNVQVEGENERLVIAIAYTILSRQEQRFLNLEVTL
ncbi:GPW/gp25 family protein [Leptolyngbya cf. ectocarpi LEGE 11479]|uniref:GPW/gp25 family protein n=1 Tax=Leptolyngbya cf. ectocarpi LEGE 11479 TaxID=1828722 RepID=A0A928ZTN8_LEPEC|nr:GPW/gp25 family protein [Leptolyngbya ectocarpi]MBE9066449.1 GPW/gp25 family protein [Leptolyngbya cf. ectocarpi LEGE 11479]